MMHSRDPLMRGPYPTIRRASIVTVCHRRPPTWLLVAAALTLALAAVVLLATAPADTTTMTAGAD